MGVFCDEEMCGGEEELCILVVGYVRAITLARPYVAASTMCLGGHQVPGIVRLGYVWRTQPESTFVLCIRERLTPSLSKSK